MFKHRIRLIAGLVAVGIFVPALVWSQQEIPLSVRAQPKTTPVADTKLLMEGIAQANFNGVAKMLKGKPEDIEAWTFARGQALLVAETGNLLLMRPPNQGRDVWNKAAIELRESATRLGRATADRDLNLSRARLTEVANACNQCHQSFRVAVRLNPFKDEK